MNVIRFENFGTSSTGKLTVPCQNRVLQLSFFSLVDGRSEVQRSDKNHSHSEVFLVIIGVKFLKNVGIYSWVCNLIVKELCNQINPYLLRDSSRQKEINPK